MADDRVVLSIDEAIAMLPDGDDIHTFRSSIPGVLVGADWKRDELIEYMKANHLELSGQIATRANHGIVVGTNQNNYLFVETKGASDG